MSDKTQRPDVIAAALTSFVSVTYGSCTILSSEPMTCPLCGIQTQPMVAHSCERRGPAVPAQKKKKGPREMSDKWAVGDRAYYFLARSPASDRPRDLYLEVTVINVTDRRVVVRQAGYPKRPHRILKPTSLVLTPPDGAWIME